MCLIKDYVRIITDNDFGKINFLRGEVAAVTKIITHINKTALRTIYFAHQLDTIAVSSGYFCA